LRLRNSQILMPYKPERWYPTQAKKRLEWDATALDQLWEVDGQSQHNEDPHSIGRVPCLYGITFTTWT